MKKAVLKQMNKDKEAICAALGLEYGTVIPTLGLEAIENKVGAPSDDVDGDPDYMAEYLERWKENAVFYCEAFTQGQARGNGSGTAGGKKKGAYQKPFERRLRLVEFVTARWAEAAGSRFNWIQIASEWNSAYPIEQIKPEVLRVEYNGAIRENDLMSHLLAMDALKDKQTGEKPWGGKQFERFFQELARNDRSGGEPVLSLYYKVVVLKKRRKIKKEAHNER